MAEVRALASAEPRLSAETLLHIATVGGAQAIGVADRFGALAAGMEADLAVFAVCGEHDPSPRSLPRPGRATTRAVMSGGRVARARRASCSSATRAPVHVPQTRSGPHRTRSARASPGRRKRSGD